MAKYDRRSTTASKHDTETNDYRGEAQLARRRTMGASAVRRVSGHMKPSISVEKIRDAGQKKPAPIPPNRNYDAFRAQLETYKTQLIDDLNTSLASTDSSVDKSMGRLAQTFDSKCKVMQDAGNILKNNFTDETFAAEVDGRECTFMLGPHMEAFKARVDEKKAHLSRSWTQYLENQIRLIELSMVVLDEEKYEYEWPVMEPHPDKRSQLVGPVNIENVNARVEKFEQVYRDATEELNALKLQLYALTSKTLSDNKAIMRKVQINQRTHRDQLKQYITTLDDA